MIGPSAGGVSLQVSDADRCWWARTHWQGTTIPLAYSQNKYRGARNVRVSWLKVGPWAYLQPWAEAIQIPVASPSGVT
ncbi:MAG: hypothetical protein JWM79_3995 [Nocardioides sp.]|nr:hypothetical protein [Nocardioides sp.]